jgi:hypothetical protein
MGRGIVYAKCGGIMTASVCVDECCLCCLMLDIIGLSLAMLRHSLHMLLCELHGNYGSGAWKFGRAQDTV